MLKQKHVDAAREVRLWMTQVVIPIGGILVLANDDIRSKINNGMNSVKDNITGVFKK